MAGSAFIDFLNRDMPYQIVIPQPDVRGGHMLFSGDKASAIDAVLRVEAEDALGEPSVDAIRRALYVAVALSDLHREETWQHPVSKRVAEAVNNARFELARDKALSNTPADLSPEPNLAKAIDSVVGPGVRGDLYPFLFRNSAKGARPAPARVGLSQLARDNGVDATTLGLLGGCMYVDACYSRLGDVVLLAQSVRNRVDLPAPERRYALPTLSHRTNVNDLYRGIDTAEIATALYSGIRMEQNLAHVIDSLLVDDVAKRDITAVLRIAAGMNTTHREQGIASQFYEAILRGLKSTSWSATAQLAVSTAIAQPRRFSEIARAAAFEHADREGDRVVQKRPVPALPDQESYEHHEVRMRARVLTAADIVRDFSPWISMTHDRRMWQVAPFLNNDGLILIAATSFEKGTPFSQVIPVDWNGDEVQKLTAEDFLARIDDEGLTAIAPWPLGERPPEYLEWESADRLAATLEACAPREAGTVTLA